MIFIIDIRIDGKQKRTYRIEAKEETQAKERLMLRLPPSQRDTLIIDSIQIDPATLNNDEPYGSFLGE
ncbi:hypothetical protein PGH07_01695 [Sulfurovum sp. zt1-1]|uniref:Uncharacterized protein n=1 Tax=Sulfurovum zhangzhouensis TaxID=3019067 RepID=A0ABT7QVX3_9BACT|nr:hypothetical protein [Sulfurovum zhangzhouensis]MDM5270886.1 hypothetical protein [Sulfurovum zhangzhouensis]